MMRRQCGFSLVEIMSTMVVFVFAIAAASQMLTGLLTHAKQQSKITETNIEGVIGLDMMRSDIEHAGYGLPWNMNSIDYDEADNDSDTDWDDSAFNDSATDVAPGAIRAGDGAALYSSDVLVIKAVNAARNDASQKWTHLQKDNVKIDDLSGDGFETDDLIIVLDPGTTDENAHTLQLNGANWTDTYNNTANYDPENDKKVFVVYGVSPTTNTVTNLSFPFNRADYYVRTPGTVPSRCATGTGILYKGTVNQSDGEITELPLLDCVANMQVVFNLDTDINGTPDKYDNAASISAFTAEDIREQVKEVRVYILAHEGQKDLSFTYPNATVDIPAAPDPGSAYGINFDFNANGITDWQNYRWKLYTMVLKPSNLGAK
ncbi:MAG: PilW family protein [Nitrospirae bacterium]|nr:PilW family protein [Nitrospirota bacterium]